MELNGHQYISKVNLVLLFFRLKEKVRSLEAEQKRKLSAREKELDEINRTLKEAEAVILERTLVGADISTVRSQKETLQVWVDCLEPSEELSWKH